MTHNAKPDNRSVPLFIPFVNRPDLLERAVLSVRDCLLVDPLVIDNSGRDPLTSDQDLPACCRTILIPPVPLTFSQTQNWMLGLARHRERPFYLFMHSDAEASAEVVERLVSRARELTAAGDRWAVLYTCYDALAAFSTAAFTAVGGWDTNLSWYKSDCDIYRRLRLAGYSLIDTGLPVHHTPSQTLNSDPRIHWLVDLEGEFRLRYYVEKWGADAGAERFERPFDGKWDQPGTYFRKDSER